MIHRIGKKKYDIYAFDIETHNDIESIKKKETSMWLGCLINDESKMDDEDSYIYNMDEFLDKVEYLSTRPRTRQKRPTRNICIYVYNLSFEWSFLLPVLLKRGFKYKHDIDKDDEFVFNSVSTRSVSSVWMIQLKFHKKSGIVLFRDLAKIYGGGLGKVAKAFKLETQKEEDFDYRLNRLHNHVVTFEEKRYCFKDCRVIIDILLKMNELNDKDFFNSASMASYSMKKLIKTGWSRSHKPYLEYRKMYPELEQEETDFLRESVAGGITYATPRYQFKTINQKILHIDAHQMHPTQMYQHIFPYGYGTKFKGKPPRRFGNMCCCRIKVSYSGVKIHSIIQLIGIDIISDMEITIWDFEIPTMYKCYEDLEIEYIDGYEYKAKFLKFRKYVADNYKLRKIAKENKDDFYILFYKLLNNSSYGKFLEKPHNIIFKNMINDDGIITSDLEESQNYRVNAKYTYLPVGSAIPARSRVSLIETALKFGWEKIIYFDTDSIFVIYDEETKNVWENQIDHTDFLGGWGLEEISDRGQFTASKRYKLDVNGEPIIKMAGINFKIDKHNKVLNNADNDDLEFSFDEINIVDSRWNIQRAFRCKGGTIIDFQLKEASIQPKYIDIYKKNVI